MMPHLNTALFINLPLRLVCVSGHFVFGLVAGFVALCFWWVVLDRDVPVELISGTIEPNPVVPGGTVKIRMRFKEHRICPGNIERRIIDNSGEVHTYVGTNTIYVTETPADEVTIDREFAIPSSIHPGVWSYAPNIEWYCNLGQRWFNAPIRVNQKGIQFEVQGVPPALQEQLDTKQQKHLEYIPLPRSNPRIEHIAHATN